MIFENLWAFLLLPLPLLIYYFVPPLDQKRRSVYAPFLSIIKNLSSSTIKKEIYIQKSVLQKTVLVISYLLLVVALAKPVLTGKEVSETISVREFFLALDLSGSMNEKDTSSGRTRLEVAKEVMRNFVHKRQKDRIGLVVFGDSAYIQSGLTDDYNSLSRSIDELEVGMAGMSTHIGDALGLSVKSLSSSVAKDKVIILFTDGNDTGSEISPLIASELASKEAIKIYPIGFGNPGSVGENPIDFSILEGIAIKTGGKLFRAANEAELSLSYEKINEIEPSKVEITKFVPFIDIYYYFLIPIFIFMLIKLFTLCSMGVRGTSV
ncbi:VWA domain-containing protein [Halobacteriovorax sp. HLS]|uniref:VWA domain-containing protein n=1 Tax=Halobacteriovorax sp. HLS TaxID=2234000 RepID=UPI000FDA5986|nr:VWA domain-containing protein [Halobacteriovorax sp. HLS]